MIARETYRTLTRRDVAMQLLSGVTLSGATHAKPLLRANWDPKGEADRVLKELVRVTAPAVKGAHDADFAIADGKAYIVAMVNEQQPGETAEWPFIYTSLSVVDLRTLSVLKVLELARGGGKFANESLPEGACFVPRIVRRDRGTLRCFFASESPKVRQSQTWFRDFDLRRGAFAPTIHRASLRTGSGVFPMQPHPYHEDAVAHGFMGEERDYGLYLIDGFKRFGRTMYAVVNNFAARQNAWASVNASLDTFTILGHFDPPPPMRLSEASVNRLPDGSWLAICRQEGKDRNYAFYRSKDGKAWTGPENLPSVATGNNSKPTFDRFRGVYYLGWQDDKRIDRVNRTVFNIDVSRDGEHWERKYRFETSRSFQYPTFREHKGRIYLTVTQGDTSPSRKERVMFGVLE